MRKTVVGFVAALALAASAAAAGTASADPGPSNKCYGEIASGIASTWPWAHEGQTDFPPPPGSIALWLKIFGPGLGVSSVRDLQLLFCS
jgi:hypothetical protein